MSLIIQPIPASVNILGDFTQVGNGSDITPTFTGSIPALNELVQVHKPSDGTLIGYYKVTAIAGDLVQLTRQNTLGVVFSTSIPAGSIMIYAFRQRSLVPGGQNLFSDSSAITPSSWTDIFSPSLDLITGVAQYLTLTFTLKHTTITDGNVRLLVDGGGYSSEVIIDFPLTIGVNAITSASANLYFNAGSGSASIKLQGQTATGSVTPLAQSNMFWNIVQDL